MLECAWWPKPARDALGHALADRPAPQAVICLSDRLAFGAYQAAYEAGLRIPDQLSIVSFDDSELAGWLRPELTSIALPHDELGRRAVRLLLAADRGTRTVLVPMPVRERESVAPPADRAATRRA
jgi:LacI family transcriptional regulator